MFEQILCRKYIIILATENNYKIGIVCYPTYGGSGVVATELGIALAEKGNEVHFISYDQPFRLDLYSERIYYHEVSIPDYPLFDFTPYELNLTSKLVDVVLHENLNILHVHYAIPHASAAVNAKHILATHGINIPIVTTLHGTDITLLGKDKSFKPVIEYAINMSDAVTVVSEDLKTRNQKGLDFYSRIIDDLLRRDIEPFLTLNHWDIPQIFLEKGGWTNRDCIQHFLDYSDIVSSEFGDRVKYWVTHNEPWVISNCGYKEGIHAPGKNNVYESLVVNHNLLVSHGETVPIIRENSVDSKVGIVLNLTPGMPASQSNADQKASKLFNQFFNDWFLDPLYGNTYPTEVSDDWIKKGIIDSIDFVKEGDYDIISAPTDFLGINYYSRGIIRSEDIPESDNLPIELIAGNKTDFDWEVYPKGLTQYKLP